MRDENKTKNQLINESVALRRRITELEKAEIRNKKTAEELDRIFNLSSDMICIADIKGYYFKKINPAFKKILGYDEKELLSRPLLDFIHPDDKEKTLNAIKEEFISGTETIHFINRYRHKDGAYKWLEWMTRPVAEEGVTYAIARDITERKRIEDTLLVASEQWRSTFDAIKDGISVIDLDGKILKCNKAFADIIGKPISEIINHMCDDLVHGVCEPIEGCPFVRMKVTGQRETLDLSIGERWFNAGADPIKDGTGNIIGAVHFFCDITERKMMEEELKKHREQLERKVEESKQAGNALRDSEERFRGVFENSAVGIVMLSPDNQWVGVNPAFCKMLDYERRELLGHSFSEVTHPDDIRTSEEVGRKLFSGLTPDFQVEKRYVRKNGEVIWGLVSAVLVRDKDGNPLHSLAMVQDITERKKTEEALRESEARYRRITDAITDYIYTVRVEDGNVVETRHGPGCRAITGYSEEEFAADPYLWIRMVVEEDRAAVQDRDRRILAGEGAAAIEHRIVRKDGLQRWVRNIPALKYDQQGSLQAYDGLIQDITLQKKLEEQLLHARKMEAIGTLAGGVAHDFNNLLMSILGYTSLMLMKTEKSHPFHEMLKIIEKQVESGAELTRQLLGFARGGKYEVKPVNVNDLIIKTSDIFGRTRKEITIHKKLQDDLHSIEADRGQLEQVLLNLYVNAWQAMPSGGELYIETRNVVDEQFSRPKDAKPGPYIEIAVTDTGVGMDAETRNRIFEPFFTTKGVARGTGLGLASAYGIIKNHGGIINVNSEKGHGTTFIIYLPASEKEVAETKTTEGSLLTGDETILMVDDERVNIEAMKELLETLGYKVLTAQNGKKAIELYREHSNDIQLVILDMIMPGMNGKETLEKLTEIDESVCVLLSSGYGINDEDKGILDLGCRGFIQKPFRADELSLKIRTMLDSAH